MKEKILVTGGGGYLGIPLVEFLLARGRKVIVADRFYFGRELLGAALDHPALETVRTDVRTIEPECFRDVETVIDLAGLSNDPTCDIDPALSREINVGGAARVARLARQAGVRRLIYSSSCSVYGQASESIVSETSPPRPVSVYAETKLAAEAELLGQPAGDMAVTVLRNATVYGLAPRMRFDLVINVMTLYAYTRGKVFVLGDGRQWRPLVHLADVCRAIELVLNAPAETVAEQIFNVGSNEQNYQVLAIAHLVREHVPNTEIEIIPDDPDKRSYRVAFDKIRDTLGFEPAAWPAEGIQEIRRALETGRAKDLPSTRTVAYYKLLLDAERLFRELAIDGKIF